MQNLINDLLDFSRVRGEERRRPEPLHKLIAEAWSLIALDGEAATDFDGVAAKGYGIGHLNLPVGGVVSVVGWPEPAA